MRSKAPSQGSPARGTPPRAAHPGQRGCDDVWVGNFDAIVIGGGAAGLMCALQAGQRGRRVLLLEHASRVGNKILISGGGRCNFTNLHCSPQNFLSANPHFAKSALARYTPADFLALVERYGIAYHEKTLGQLFCDGSARQIVDLLVAECRDAAVEIRTGIEVRDVRHEAVAGQFHLTLAAGDALAAPALVVATGGLSIPKMGATGFGYDLARQFGHRLVEPHPALVPLVFTPEDRARWCDLAGVATTCVAQAEPLAPRQPAPAFREKLLVTHRGLSGPAILQASSYWRPGTPLTLDLAPAADPLAALRARPAGRDLAAYRAALRTALPQRLADRWAEVHPPRDWSNHGLEEAGRLLHHWRVTPAGTEGYEKAEVTAGGVDTRDLSAQSLESRLVPGLYFIGEVVDVTGELGGFNFQWAWASAAAAGRSL